MSCQTCSDIKNTNVLLEEKQQQTYNLSGQSSEVLQTIPIIQTADITASLFGEMKGPESVKVRWHTARRQREINSTLMFSYSNHLLRPLSYDLRLYYYCTTPAHLPPGLWQTRSSSGCFTLFIWGKTTSTVVFIKWGLITMKKALRKVKQAECSFFPFSAILSWSLGNVGLLTCCYD